MNLGFFSKMFNRPQQSMMAGGGIDPMGNAMPDIAVAPMQAAPIPGANQGPPVTWGQRIGNLQAALARQQQPDQQIQPAQFMPMQMAPSAGVVQGQQMQQRRRGGLLGVGQ